MNTACIKIVLVIILIFAGSGASATLVNIAPLGTATQSTTYSATATADKAIDGILDGNYFVNVGTHTLYETSPWWQVVFDQDYLISELDVYNRTDCCDGRLSFARLVLLNDGAEVFSYTMGVAPTILTLDVSNIQADTFRIDGMTGFLSIAEAQAFSATPVPEPGSMALISAALASLVIGRRKTTRSQSN